MKKKFNQPRLGSTLLKFDLKMKLSLLLLFTTLLGLHANDSYAQKAKVSLNVENATIQKVLDNIESTTKFNFVYNTKHVDLQRKVSLKLNQEHIDKVLERLFSTTSTNYKVKGTQVILWRSNVRKVVEGPTPQVAVPEPLVVQFIISGMITDSEGTPLPGANILEKGTTNGTQADFDGNFSIGVADENATLVVSYIGFATKEVQVSGQASLSIILEDSAAGLDEVVVVGYGTQKKSDLTGSVISADLEAFEEAPNSNILQSIQGALPGVQIGQTNQAGEAPSISVRGTTTLNGNTDVLIVLDGIIYRGNMSDLNPGDIKSIEVLKDASSKAIYGAQAANGVILLTSKGGSKTNEKVQINYNVFTSFQTPTVNAGLLDREQFLRKVKDIDYRNAYLAPDYLVDNPEWDYPQSALRAMHIEGINNGTEYDWFDQVTNSGYMVNHNLSLQGNTGGLRYFVSGNHVNQQGVIINDKYKRSSLRVNVEIDIAEWLKFGVNSFGSFNDYSGVSPNLSTIATTSPFVRSKDENDEYIFDVQGNGLVNPFLSALADDKDIRNNLSANLYFIASLPFIEGLTYRLNYNNNLRWNEAFNSDIYASNQAGVAYKTNSSTHDLMFDNILSYEKEFGEIHRINLTGVIGINKINYENTTARGQNFTDLALSYNSLQQAGLQTITSGAWEESFLYQMIRGSYTLKNRYLLNATLRRDGYSGFSQNNKIGLFPSVGLGWVISQESFFQSNGIDYLKLRGSYGQNGNLTGRYSSLGIVDNNPLYYYLFGDGGATELNQFPSSLANNNLSWERTNELNFGVDFNLKNNRLDASIDYYNTTTTDLLWNLALPTITGFSNVRSNIGELNNQGIELNLGSQIINKNDWSWSVNANFAANRNRIVSLLGDVNQDGEEDDLISSGLFIGESIGTIYSYEIDGIWQIDDDIPDGYEPGTYRIVDQNDDGNITPGEDRIILGESEPSYRISFQNSLRYKNLSLKFFVNSIQGGNNKFLLANNSRISTPGNLQNYNWYNFTDYWSPSQSDSEYDAGWTNPAIRASKYQSRSFVRLQDISLSYDIPKTPLNSIGVSDLKIFLSGKNLLTFTKWDGWDPETGQGIFSSDNYPVLKSYSIGLDIKF